MIEDCSHRGTAGFVKPASIKVTVLFNARAQRPAEPPNPPTVLHACGPHAR